MEDFRGHPLEASSFPLGQQLIGLLSTKEYTLGIGKPSCLAVDLLSLCQSPSSFYDAMDDFPQFHNGLSQGSVRRNEERIAELADYIVCSSTALQKKFSRFDGKLSLVMNAFDEQLIPFSVTKVKLDRPK